MTPTPTRNLMASHPRIRARTQCPRSPSSLPWAIPAFLLALPRTRSLAAMRRRFRILQAQSDRVNWAPRRQTRPSQKRTINRLRFHPQTCWVLGQLLKRTPISRPWSSRALVTQKLRPRRMGSPRTLPANPRPARQQSVPMPRPIASRRQELISRNLTPPCRPLR